MIRCRTFSTLLINIDDNFVVLSTFVLFHSIKPMSPRMSKKRLHFVRFLSSTSLPSVLLNHGQDDASDHAKSFKDSATEDTQIVLLNSINSLHPS